MFVKLQHYDLKPCKVILHRIKEEISGEILSVNQPKQNGCDKSKFCSIESCKINLPKIKEEIKEEFLAVNETIDDVCKENCYMENDVPVPSEIAFPKIKEEIKGEYTVCLTNRDTSSLCFSRDQEKRCKIEQDDGNYEDDIVEFTQDSDLSEACYSDIPQIKSELKDHFKWDSSHNEVTASSSNSVSDADDDTPNQYIEKEDIEEDLLFEDEMTISEEYLQLNRDYEGSNCAVDPLSTESDNSTFMHQNAIHDTECSALTSQSLKGTTESESAGNQKFLFFCTCCPVWSPDEQMIKLHNLKHALEKRVSNCEDQTRQQGSSPVTGTNDQAIENTFACTVCAAKFTDKSSLEWHIRGHTSDKPFACTDCPARFYKKESLKGHLRSHITGLIYPCLLCPAKFSQKISLDNHILVHKVKPSENVRKVNGKLNVTKSSKAASGMRVPCSFCKGKLLHKRKRGRPRKDAPLLCPNSSGKMLKVEKQFSCSSCSAKFYLEKHLAAHMLKHSSEVPKCFSCSVCPAKFSLKTQLSRHFLSHSGEKPFSCSLCPAKFTLESYLTTHVLSHSGEKPFSCPKCPAKFTLKCYLKKHMTIHTLCSQKLNWKARILSHMT